jgi:TP901 family phage tail tape measure protein
LQHNNKKIMAKIITDEEIQLSIVINGNAAQKELHDLERSTVSLKQANKALNEEKKRMEAQGLKNTQRFKDLTEEIKKNNASITSNNARMHELQNQIGLTGLTMVQLRQRATLLKTSLSNMIPGSADFVRVQGELTAINARLGELSGRAVTARSAIATLADGFNRYSALGASVIGALAGISLTIQKIIDLNGKLSDAQANVQKTTGMTKEEVDELSISFGKLNTRTSKTDLLGIAEVGGQLGIAKEDIGEFVEVMNKAGVALGKSFEGGVTAVAEKLGRIKGLYAELGDVSIKTAFESVGSAMNELAAQGTATEENIAAFVTRVGAMPAALKPSIEESLGLAAAFEETGLKAELAAGNYSKVISIGAKSAGDFAKVMKMSKKEVEDLINTNPNEFFLKFAESLKGMNATQMAQTLDTLKLNDNEVKMVLGSAMNNIELFRKKIELSNQSMAEATSMTREYEIMNNTLQATLEKVQKKISGIFTSDALVKFLLGAVTWFAKLLGVTEDTSGRFAVLRSILVNLAKVFAIVVASTLSYKAALILVNTWTRTLAAAQSLYNLVMTRGTVVTNILRSSKLLLASAQALFTGNTTRATAAMRLFNITTKMNPLGLLLGVLTAVATAFVLYRNRATEASIATETLTKLQFTVERNIDTEKNKLNQLLLIALDETISKQRRKEAIDAINKISPEYLGNLTLENIKTAEATRSLDRYIQSLEKKAMAEAFNSQRKELSEKKLDAKQDVDKNKTVNKFKFSALYDTEQKLLRELTVEERKIWFAKTRGIDDVIMKEKLLSKTMSIFNDEEKKHITTLKGMGGFNNDFNEYKRSIGEAVIGLKALAEEEKKFIKENPGVYTGSSTGVEESDVVSSSSSSTSNKNNIQQNLENERKQRADMLAQMTADALQMKREAEDAKLAIMAEGLEKEIMQEKYYHDRKMQDMKRNLISEVEIEAALKKANNVQLSKEEREFYEGQANHWQNKNKHIHSILESEKVQHNLRKKTIELKFESERFKDLEEQFNREKTIREVAFQEEINGKTFTEDELKKKREDFDKAELEHHNKHIDSVIIELKKLIEAKKIALETGTLSKDSAQYQKESENIKILTDEVNKLALAKKSVSSGGGTEKDLLGGLGSGLGGITDVFGFSPDHWEKMFDNLKKGEIGVGEIATAVSSLVNIWGQYNKIVSANEQKQIKQYEANIDKRKTSLKLALDNGWITQQEYNERVAKMDEELATKKAKMEYDAAVRERDIAVISSIINTAVGVTKAAPNIPLQILVGAAGAIQTALIASQEIPSPSGYEEGYYPVKREQDGKVFQAKRGGYAKSGMVNKPTHFLAGENGQFFPEMIIDGRSFKNFSPELKENLYNELNGIRGYERGYIPHPNPPQRGGSNSTSQIGGKNIDNRNFNIGLETLIRENVAILREIKEDGIMAVVSDRDFISIDKLNKAQEKLRKIKDKRIVNS